MDWGNLEIKRSNKFMTVDEQNPQQVRLIGDAVERFEHGFGKEASVCQGEGCLKCKQGDEAKQKFKMNVYNWTVGKVQIWNFSAGVAKQLKGIAKSIASEDKGMDDVDLKISAAGTNKDKRYTIIPWPSTKTLPTGLALYDLEDSGIPF